MGSHGRRGQSTRSENLWRASGGGGRNYIKTRRATRPLSGARMQYKYVVLTNTTIGTFMALLDSNIVLISLPTIIRDLPGTTTVEGIWIILGYVLVTASLLLTIGRLADLYGRVRLYNLGFAVFTIGSGLCSLSPNGQSRVLFRLVQGIGAGLLVANSGAIVIAALPVADRRRARRAGRAVRDDGPRVVPKQSVLRRGPQQPPRVDRSGGGGPRPRLLLPGRARPRRVERGAPADSVLPGVRQHRSPQRLPLGQVRPPRVHDGRSAHLRGVLHLVRDAPVRGFVLDLGHADDPRGH